MNSIKLSILDDEEPLVPGCHGYDPDEEERIRQIFEQDTENAGIAQGIWPDQCHDDRAENVDYDD